MAISVSAFGQSQPTFTTLSSAIADARTNRLVVASATGFVASNTATGLDYGVFIDTEFMRITAVSGTTITVQRGQSATTATPHASGQYVFVGQYGSQQQSGTQTGGPFVQSGNFGACTRTAYPYLPVIQVNASVAAGGQAFYDCINGTWSRGTLIGGPGGAGAQQSLAKVCNVAIGSVAYGSFGTSTTASTTAQLMTSIYVPTTFIATGITQLNGSAVDTASKKIVILYSGGHGTDTNSAIKIANSATAGTAATGNDAFQAIAFTSRVIVVGPAYYFIGLQDDTADVNGLRTVAASTFNNIISDSVTSVFGTVGATYSPVATFTADEAPISCLY